MEEVVMVQVDQSSLWNEIQPGAVYPANDKWHAYLVDQYKLYVEMADRVSQRRITANSYFLSVNSAILAFIGYLTSKELSEYLWVLAIGGGALTVFWYTVIVSYRNLNTAKWSVVHEIEKRLPISPYTAEWLAVEQGRNSRLYRPISHVESRVPWVFFVLHLFVFLKSAPWSNVFHKLQILSQATICQ